MSRTEETWVSDLENVGVSKDSIDALKGKIKEQRTAAIRQRWLIMGLAGFLVVVLSVLLAILPMGTLFSKPVRFDIVNAILTIVVLVVGMIWPKRNITIDVDIILQTLNIRTIDKYIYKKIVDSLNKWVPNVGRWTILICSLGIGVSTIIKHVIKGG